MKVVINTRYGGFSISKKAAEFMANKGCKQARAELEEYNLALEQFHKYKEMGKCDPEYGDHISFWNINIKYNSLPKFYGYGYGKKFNDEYKRDSPYLVQAVEELGEASNGEHAELKVVEIPDGVQWEISEYDGMESVHECHRVWN